MKDKKKNYSSYCIYLIKKYCKNCNNGKYYILKQLFSIHNIFENVLYSCDGKANFSAAITPVFSVT